MNNDTSFDKEIKDYKRTRDALRKLIMGVLRRMGLDVQNWKEAEMCARYMVGK